MKLTDRVTKIFIITLILFSAASYVTAGILRDSNRYALFGDNGGMGDSKTINTVNGERKVWLLAQNDEWIYFNGKMLNNWPDSTTQYMVQTGSQTQTNIPAAATELTGTYRVRGDFTEKDQIRFGTTLAVAGNTGSRLYVQYTIGGVNWFNVSITDATINLSGNTPNTVTTSWEEIPAGMKLGDTTLRVMTVGGDGAADPQYRGVWIEAR